MSGLKIGRNISFYTIIYCLILPYLLVDSVNGALIREGGPSISSIYKFIILALILIYLRRRSLVLFVAGVMLMYFVVHSLILSDPVEAAKGLVLLSKFLAIVILFVFFKKVVRKGNEEWIYVLAIVSFAILAINLVLGAMGYGYPQYVGAGGQWIGARGFIFTGNEMASAVVFSSALILMRLIIKEQRRAFLIFAVVNVGISALSTSKVAILSSLILFLAFPIIDSIVRKNRGTFNRDDKRFLFLIAVMAPLAGFAGIHYALYKMHLIARLAYNYAHHDLVTVAFSSRNVWAAQAMKTFGSLYSFFEWMFGTGKQWWIHISGTKLVEIDIIDMLMTYGIVGMTIVYGFFTILLCGAWRSRRRNPYAIHITLMLLLALGISVTSGHIVYSGITAPLLAAMMALAFSGVREKSENTRIFLISNMYPSRRQPSYGIFVRNFEEAMDGRGMEITRAVIRGRGQNVLEKLWKYFRLIFETYMGLLEGNYDVIYVHYATHSLLPLVPARPFIRKPLVINFHGSDFSPYGSVGRSILALNRSLIRHAVMLVVPSEFFRAKVNEKYLHPNIYVSHSGGVDLSRFTPGNKQKEERGILTIGYVSRIEQSKGWDVLLKALHNLKNERPEIGFETIFVGGGKEIDSLKDRVGALGLESSVSCVGPKRQSELPPIYRSFDLFIFPTIRPDESLGLVGLEAMACGVPVIGSNTGGLTGYVRHGENGFLFEPGNFKELTERIAVFWKMSLSERQSLSQQAIRTARQYDSVAAYDGLAMAIREVVT